MIMMLHTNTYQDDPEDEQDLQLLGELIAYEKVTEGKVDKSTKP